MDVLKREDWTGNVTNELRNFEQTLIIALKQKGMCGTLYLLKYANVFCHVFAKCYANTFLKFYLSKPR